MLRVALVLAALLIPSVNCRYAYRFSDGIESILSAPVAQSFDCTGLGYGYYADIDNNCEVFHVCHPIEDDLGEVIQTLQWTFACGNGLVFNQETLTCTTSRDSLPCGEAKALYEVVNSEFGRIPDEKK